MKLKQTAKRFKTNADVQSEDFTIGDPSVVIEILRNKMYKHKIRTLVQEYISNARDAMREIKSTDKVIVTLPTMLTPTFKVRDFGPGITPDRIKNVFTKYGSSTKRNSNLQTGGFGIGAKSAWSYVDSFTVTTFIDGVQRQYVAHIGANNNGRLDFLGDAKTTEKNGTLIEIPVSSGDVGSFKSAAKRCVYFWSETETPTFVNETLPAKIKTEKIGKNVEVVHQDALPDYLVNRYDNGALIVIDGIAYVADSSFTDKVKSLAKLNKVIHDSRVILRIPNGVVEVAASREEISDSKLSIDNLELVTASALADVDALIKKSFGAVTNAAEYLTEYTKLTKHYNLDNYRTYGDFSVRYDEISSELFGGVNFERISETANGSLNKKSNATAKKHLYNVSVKLSDWDNLYFSEQTDNIIVLNQKIRTALQGKGQIILITKRTTDAGEYDKLKAALHLKNVDLLAQTKPVRMPRDQRLEAKTKEQFTIRQFDYPTNKRTTLDSNTQKWYYIPNSTPFADVQKAEQIDEYLKSAGGKFRVCRLADATIKRVDGDKNFLPLSEFFATFTPTDKEINVMKRQHARNGDLMTKLQKVQGIKHKFINEMVDEYKNLLATTNNIQVTEPIKELIGKVKEIEDFKTKDTELHKLINKDYSLLTDLYWNSRVEREIVHYINAK